jgi:hypothetical protein
VNISREIPRRRRNDGNQPERSGFPHMSMYYINIRTDSHIASTTEFETDSLTHLRLKWRGLSARS